MKTKMLKMGYLLITSFICAGFLSSAYAGQTPALPKQASIATHLVGGIFHALGMGVAKVVTNHTPIRVVVKPTSGPFTYMPMLNTGEVEMGLPNSLDTKYAFDGSPILKYERTNNLRMLLPGGPNVGMIPIVARKDSGIKTIADLKGRRVTAGFSGNVVMALQMEGHLALGGLSWDDVVKVPVVDYKTALHMAKSPEVAAVLLEHGAAVNARDKSKHTPLHTCGDVRIARLLLDNGVDMNAKDKFGQTALAYALVGSDHVTPRFREQYRAIAKLLRERGAKEN